MLPKRKLPYLETSPEKFQQMLGNGSCNTDSPTPTGNRIAAILLPKKDSLSLTGVPSKPPSDDTSESSKEQKPPENGSSTETSLDQLLFWNQRKEVPMKG